jgi:hypothetical protein
MSVMVFFSFEGFAFFGGGFAFRAGVETMRRALPSAMDKQLIEPPQVRRWHDHGRYSDWR